MATAIPSANLKVFPSADDINSGDVGAGNIVTEENMTALLKSMPPKNFIIDGFEMARASDDSVTIEEGEAFVGGYYVKTDAQITYTIDPVTTGAKALYFYLTVDVSGTATGAQFINSTQDVGSIPDPDEALSVFLGVAIADSSGDIKAGQVSESKRNYGGGVASGSYVGTGDAGVDLSTLKIEIVLAPSFVYVAGEVGTGSNVAAASALIPAGARSLNGAGAQMIGGFYSCGWCIVSSATINTHPKTYTASTGTWPGGEIAANSWGRTTVSVPGARPGDLVIIGGDNFIGTGAGGIGEDSSGLDGVISVPASVYEGGAISDGPTGEDISADSSSTEFLVVTGYVSADDTVTWGIYNTDGGGRTPNPSNTGTIMVLSAWELQTTTQTFLDTGTSAVSELRPALTSVGFDVTRTPAGISSSGETLNTLNQNYNYWAFS